MIYISVVTITYDVNVMTISSCHLLLVLSLWSSSIHFSFFSYFTSNYSHSSYQIFIFLFLHLLWTFSYYRSVNKKAEWFLSFSLVSFSLKFSFHFFLTLLLVLPLSVSILPPALSLYLSLNNYSSTSFCYENPKPLLKFTCNKMKW